MADEPTSGPHKRRQRVVKNSYVEVDSVTVPSGDNYCDWVRITKEKLQVQN